MSLLASSTELPTLTSISLVVRFAGLQPTTWDRLGTALGTPPDLRILAMMPAEVLQKAIHDLRISVGTAPTDGSPQQTREPNATEAIQMALVWRVARQVMGLPDVDPLVTNATSTSTHSPVLAGGTGGSGGTGVASASPTGPPAKKVKISSVLDQTDETYADFSILTPFGRRMQKTMKMKSYAFQPDGSWKTADPGPPKPPGLASMLQGVQGSPVHVEVPRWYNDLASDHRWPSGAGHEGAGGGAAPFIGAVLRVLHGALPGVPRMLASADASRRQNARRKVRAPEEEFGKSSCSGGWDGVFQAAARDHQYWAANVRRPAVVFLARAGSAPQPALEPMSEGAKASIRNIETAMGATASQPEVKKRKKRKRPKDGKGGSGDTDSKEEKETPVNKKLVDKQNNREHPKKWGGMFHTTQEGKPVCYAFAKGSSPDACPGNCKNGRAHKCMLCLGNHQNKDCPKKQGKAGGKGEKK